MIPEVTKKLLHIVKSKQAITDLSIFFIFLQEEELLRTARQCRSMIKGSHLFYGEGQTAEGFSSGRSKKKNFS